MIAMNTYYTAKDIEELATRGTRQIVLNPGTFLTDFARETAQQLGIALVKSDAQGTSSPSAALGNPARVNQKYNKPSGCQHISNSFPADRSQAFASSGQIDGAGSNTANRLIGLLGKAIKRGG